MNVPHVMPKPRFTLVVKPPTGWEWHQWFYTLAGLEQWLDNARALGQVGERDKVSIYDDSGCRL